MLCTLHFKLKYKTDTTESWTALLNDPKTCKIARKTVKGKRHCQM